MELQSPIKELHPGLYQRGPYVGVMIDILHFCAGLLPYIPQEQVEEMAHEFMSLNLSPEAWMPIRLALIRHLVQMAIVLPRGVRKMAELYRFEEFIAAADCHDPLLWWTQFTSIGGMIRPTGSEFTMGLLEAQSSVISDTLQQAAEWLERVFVTKPLLLGEAPAALTTLEYCAITVALREQLDLSKRSGKPILQWDEPEFLAAKQRVARKLARELRMLVLVQASEYGRILSAHGVSPAFVRLLIQGFTNPPEEYSEEHMKADALAYALKSPEAVTHLWGVFARSMVAGLHGLAKASSAVQTAVSAIASCLDRTVVRMHRKCWEEMAEGLWKVPVDPNDEVAIAVLAAITHVAQAIVCGFKGAADRECTEYHRWQAIEWAVRARTHAKRPLGTEIGDYGLQDKFADSVLTGYALIASVHLNTLAGP